MNLIPASQSIKSSPEETLSDAEVFIQRRLNGRIHDFRLTMREDGIVLGGHARTYYAKQLAQHAVMETLDLPIYANEIEVR